MKKIIVLSMVLIGCANGPRTVVEADPNKPSWVSSSKISWVDGDQIFFHTQYSVRGDERVNGCFQLAKLDSKETLIREIAEDIRGQIDNAQQGISENTELLLSQVRSSEYSGKVVGMDRIAVMAALNIAHELLRSRGRESEVDGTLGGRLRAMCERVETALEHGKQLEF